MNEDLIDSEIDTQYAVYKKEVERHIETLNNFETQVEFPILELPIDPSTNIFTDYLDEINKRKRDHKEVLDRLSTAKHDFASFQKETICKLGRALLKIEEQFPEFTVWKMYKESLPKECYHCGRGPSYSEAGALDQLEEEIESVSLKTVERQRLDYYMNKFYGDNYMNKFYGDNPYKFYHYSNGWWRDE